MRLSSLSLLAVGASAVRAGYMTVGMGEARQCNMSTVEWYGDDGPYHLLLTPTSFVSHGYNVWVQSIPNGTTSYDLPINQPAGMQFMVTVWGASGIEYAGTTNVLTILPSLSNFNSCFLSDAAISGLYSFAFNISSTNNGFPPQCSNLSISWPTSLESEVRTFRRDLVIDGETGKAEWNDDSPVHPADRRNMVSSGDHHALSVITPDDRMAGRALSGDSDTSSSNKTSGNTTTPPTMFGIIPLGNSFSIPITYPSRSKISEGLAPESISDDPTTWTSHGVTHLNWTINLAKGTRFIIVAGIGSKEEWASGGSSEMMTVGQGGSACFNQNPDIPKITATASEPHGSLTRPTSTSSSPSDSASQTSKNGRSFVVIVLACIFSVVGTLVVIGFLWFCCCVHRKRKRATKQGRPKPSVLNIATFGRFDAKHGERLTKRDGAETQLDLINGYDDFSETATPPGSTTSRRPPHPFASPPHRLSNATSMSPSSPEQYPDSPYERPYAYTIHGSIGGSRPSSTAYDEGPFPPRAVTMFEEPSYAQGYGQGFGGWGSGSQTSPRELPRPRRDSSPARQDFSRHDIMGRQSVDGFGSYPPLLLETKHALGRSHAVPHDTYDSDDSPVTGPLVDLKRETLAMLDSHPNSPHTPQNESSSPRTPVAGPSRRRDAYEETEYVVHRDAGRLTSRRVELPPRYDQLNWDSEAEPDLAEVALTPRASTDASPATVPPQPIPPVPPVPPIPPNLSIPNAQRSQTQSPPTRRQGLAPHALPTLPGAPPRQGST